MTRIEKLLKKFIQNPTSVDGAELDKILRTRNYLPSIRNSSHITYKKQGVDEILTLPLHHWDIKPIYKLKIKKLLFPSDN